MRLLARVLHSSGIVQNCYAEPAWGSRWINTNQLPVFYSSEIWPSELVKNARMYIVKIGHLCIAYGSFRVQTDSSVVNIDLFNISNTGISPATRTLFSAGSFNVNSQSGIGELLPDGRVIFALRPSGLEEWRFNFSFMSTN